VAWESPGRHRLLTPVREQPILYLDNRLTKEWACASSLITSRREGQNIIYSLNTTVVQDLAAIICDLLGVGSSEGKETKS
jgi:hypothetical protein